jgi:P-type conjugative transfer protein TrbJ
MHSRSRRTAIRAATALALSFMAGAPKASGIPTFDGANFAQQLLSVMNQTQQLTQQTMMVQQNLTNLQSLGGNVLNLAEQAYGGQGIAMRDLTSSVSQLYQAGAQLQRMYDSASAEMKSLDMTPERWGTAYVHLAQTKGGVYRKQLDQDFSTMEAFTSRAANLRQLSRQIPGIEGNVQGLQLLNQQSSVLAGELLEMRSLMQRQVVLDLQDRATKEDLNKLSVEGAQQRYDAVAREAASKRSAIGKMQSLEFGL